jgi:serine protease inhibitor
MLAEITDGNSRRQILDALVVPSLEILRGHVEALWEDAYFRHQEGYEMCILANSLWLDQGLDYDRETMDNLSYYHYASVFQTDLQEDSAAGALRTWLNNSTGGLLKDFVQNSGFSPESVLTLASTIYLQATWSEEFNPSRNSQDIFHAPAGDREVTFMNKKLTQMYYHWGESFGAVALGLKNNTRMWFFLPDADKNVDDILREGQYLDTISEAYSTEGENRKYVKVNLSVPKFDISSGCDAAGLFRKMGITDIFDITCSDFSAITADTPIAISGINQAARVLVDEQGVKAAAYLEIPGAGAAAPPDEIIDFILDRPFLFVIATHNGTPLFTGVVNSP